MRTRIDLTGETFGRLTVLRFSHTVRGQSVWLCRCTCGKEVMAEARRLRRGEKKSCGCLRTGSHVFLHLYGHVLDAMEDFHITLEAQ